MIKSQRGGKHHSNRSVSGFSPYGEKNKKPDKEADRRSVVVSFIQKKVYDLLIEDGMAQSKIARITKRSRQTINGHVKKLKSLGLIDVVDDNASPKFYISTLIIPLTRKTKTAKLSSNSKMPKHRVGFPYKAVRDHKTGRFKGKRLPRGTGVHRDYNTIISVDGKRLKLIRANAISYECVLKREPMGIPWKKVGGPHGMEQWVYHHEFPNNRATIDDLKVMDVTFLRKKTTTYDVIVIYLPEKYVLESELDVTLQTMSDYGLIAWNWLRKKFKVWMDFPKQYRSSEYAVEINDPRLKLAIKEHGMVKVPTASGGYVVIDESKKGHPEKEFTSLDEIKTELTMPEHILMLERELSDIKKELPNMFSQIKDEISQLFSQLKVDISQMVKKEIGDAMKIPVEDKQKELERIKENFDRGIM